MDRPSGSSSRRQEACPELVEGAHSTPMRSPEKRSEPRDLGCYVRLACQEACPELVEGAHSTPMRSPGKRSEPRDLGCYVRLVGSWCAFAFALSAGAAIGAVRPDPTQTPASKTEARAAFFAERSVLSFHVEVDASDLAKLRRAPRTYVHGTVRQGALELTNVGIRLKGMGSFRTVDEKPSLTLKFDEFVPGQEYCGLTKLLLNNSAQDPTYLAELLATGLFRDAGVPAARVTHALVQLNGRDLGLCVAIEAMNKRFLKEHFRSAEGNLYEGYLADIDAQLDQDNGKPGDQEDRKLLLEATRIEEPHRRYQELNCVLDIDRFISFAAMEMLVAQWDGYAIHTNNYRLYHDPSSDKMVFITHGLDWAFRRPNTSIQPPTKSIVGRAVLQTQEGQRLYRERVGTLFTNVFRLPVLSNRIDQALARIRATALNPSDLALIERNATLLRERITLRAQRVGEQLAGIPPAPLRLGTDGTAQPEGWREEFDRGEPVMDRPEADGKATLHVQARGGRSRASWRAQVCLAQGRYRFEGLLRTEGVTGGSVGLRISGDTTNRRINGTTAWRAMAHEFEVKDPIADVEVVCEFHALQGEVWFDLNSLKLRRL